MTRKNKAELYPPQRLKGLDTGPRGPALEEGQVSINSRVRLREDAAQWWSSLKATERGALIEHAHESLGLREDAQDGVRQLMKFLQQQQK